MRFKQYISTILLSFIFAGPAIAADFDGSKALVCATVQASDCVLGSSCFAGEAHTLGAPQFVRVDFKNKQMVGQKRTSPIASMVKQDDNLILQGTELEFGWSFALNQNNGKFSASLTNPEGSFLLFGWCTPD
jgi:hypothetical protein